MPEDLRITAVTDMDDGLQYLHEKELVHGNIKPLNVLVCGEQDKYIFKITDYACLGNKVNTEMSSKSVSLKQLMTPAYTAPELFSIDGCNVHATKASDIYSLGILAYEIILGLEPWKTVSINLINKDKHSYWPVIPENAPQIIVDIIEKCWVHDRALRPSALEVSKVFEEYLGSGCTEAQVNNCTDMYEWVSLDCEDSSTSVTTRTGHLDTSQTINQSSLTESSHNIEDGLSDNVGTSNLHVNVTIETLNTPDVSEACEQTPPAIFTCSDVMSGNNDEAIQIAKATLKIKELKHFQVKCLAALQAGIDAIVVQPTASGKSVCFTLPALLSPGKVTLVIKPVVAVITNQVKALRKRS